ncbi:AfsR/SARP family transcriptional regulator [Flindersiella endophytica]
MRIRLFGEMEFTVAGRRLDLGTPRQQAVLAALIVDAGHPVPTETLIDRVWDEDPPVEARNVLYSYLSRIRRVLKQAAKLTGEPPVLLERRYAGYVLEVDPDAVDLHQFRRLIETGRDPRGSDVERADALTEALELWRGAPLAGVQGEWVTQVRRSWRQMRLDAVLQWAQAELHLGRTAAVISTLPDVIAEYPYVEPLEGLLMRALHAEDRDAEAIDRYTAVRDRLAEQLGTDPGAELATLHQSILRGDLPPLLPDQPAATTNQLAVPAQLPPDTYAFTGREPELARLDTMVAESNQQPTAVVISAVSGTAGVGKTALAVHWAHSIRDRFPDGQLYVNLRGFDPGGQVMNPTDAVRGFLDALGTPPEQIPVDLAAQTALYRSRLDGKQVLVVLDNARDTDQIRPLLPSSAGCLVVVTSRNQLTSLIVTQGAHPLTLDLLTTTEARQLLSRRLGPERITAAPQAVDDIIDSCARLPLALAIVAARAATYPTFPLAALAAELRDTHARLDAFTTTETGTETGTGSDVRAVFSWSYRQLNPAAARLFRFLGLHPGPDISAPAAASLAGIPPEQVRPILAELTQTHLVSENTPSRYTFHDLLRAYANELAHTHDTQAERTAAVHRILDHYLHTAHRAALLLNPTRDQITISPPQAGVTPEDLADHGQAMAWFSTEHPVLLTALDQAASGGFASHTWQLAWTLFDYLHRRGLWRERAVVAEVALCAARQQGDRETQARTHRHVALAYQPLGRFDEAHTHLQQALDLYGELGDHTGQARAHIGFARILEQQGRHTDALHHSEQALDLYRAAGNRMGQAHALNSIGWSHVLLGHHQQALTSCRQALGLHEQLDDPEAEAATWDSLGYAHHHLGHHQEAIACYRHALDLFQVTGHRYHEADVLLRLGETQHASRDHDTARISWQHALDILEELGHPDAEDVRAKLHHLDPPAHDFAPCSAPRRR